MNKVPVEYMLDAAGMVADALLVWWITAGHFSASRVLLKIPRENEAAIDASRS